MIINLFGELKIITSTGTITEKDINSAKLTRFITYLLLHKSRPVSATKIFSDLWPEEYIDNPAKNVRNLVYRLQQMFGQISAHRLIEASSIGFQINPELTVYSDIAFFEECWHQAQLAPSSKEKAAILKRAIDMYKEGLQSDFTANPWFVATESYYSMRYEGVMNQLLTILDEAADYPAIHEYANSALRLLPGSADLYFWLIYSMQHLGATEIARNELKAAKQALTEDDYSGLLLDLREVGFIV